MATISVGREKVEVSSADKVLFPDAGITKGELVEYYRRIAPVMLPYLKGRPISMQRYPRGVRGPGFFQKERPEFFPSYVREVIVKTEYGTLPQIVIDNAATLVYLANQNCVTPHTWLSKADPPDRIDYPDQLVVDLDPPKDDFELVRFAARELKALLDELKLKAFLKTTGSRGLHVVLPLDGKASFDAVRAFAMRLADALAARHPDRLTTEHYKQKRRGRLYLDVARNAYAQTAVPPLAVRARPGAPVATPLTWEELEDKKLRSDRWNLRTIFERLEKVGDPWKGKFGRGQSVEQAQQRLAKSGG